MTPREMAVLKVLEKMAQLPAAAAALLDEKKLRDLPETAELDYDQKLALLNATIYTIDLLGYELYRKASRNLEEFSRREHGF